MRASLHILLLLFISVQVGAAPLRVAVAANFKPALATINAVYEAETGQKILLSSASTGTLYSQISHGAPFSVFFSADRTTAERIRKERSTPADRPLFCYAQGTLALVGSNDLAQLANPKLSVAIANPAVAPYGIAATQVLQRSEFAAGTARKLVKGNNAAQAYQFWHTGNTQLALVPTALLYAVPPGDDWVAIPEQWHDPIAQYLVALQSDDAVNAYLNWIRSDRVRAIIQQAGYQLCP